MADDSVKQAVETLKAALAPALGTIDRKLDALNTRLSAVEDRVSDLEVDLEDEASVVTLLHAIHADVREVLAGVVR